MWVFLWQEFISKAGTSQERSFIDLFLAERNALLLIALVAGVVYHLTRRMPDTVVIRCQICRTDGKYLVRFAGRSQPVHPDGEIKNSESTDLPPDRR